MDKRKTVLLADANEEFRTMLREEIERSEEFTVVGSVGDGAEALSVLTQRRPDLLVLDLMLPGMDGLTLLRQAQEQGPLPKVVITSAFCTDRVVSDAMALGVSYFLPKPCETGTLLIYKEELSSACDNLYICTDDGSEGFHGVGTAMLEKLVAEGARYTRCVAIGPMIMMKSATQLF